MKRSVMFRWTVGYLILLCCFTVKVSGQSANGRPLFCTDEDRAIFARFLREMDDKRSLPVEALTIEVARFFLGAPYVAATLEKEPEGLVVNFRELDCTTFVETVLTLTRTLKEPDPSFDTYCRLLQGLRYRNGIAGEYTDRLHYTSDWLYENGRKGIVQDITCTIGGVSHPVTLSFMSTHPDSYAPLKDQPERIAFMAAKEKEISARAYCYIPEADIERLGAGMHSGDMVCFVTSIAGLDISHVGIICRTEGKLTFIHASSSAKKVILNDDPLAVYVQKIKSNTGIMVARLK